MEDIQSFINERKGPIQSLINEIVGGRKSHAELLSLVPDSAALVRVNAMMQIPKQFPAPETVGALERAGADPRNGIRLLGCRIAWIAVGALLSMRRPDATSAAQRVIAAMPTVERGDLSRYLRGEGLDMPSSS